MRCGKSVFIDALDVAHEMYDVWIKASAKSKFLAGRGGKNDWAVPNWNLRGVSNNILLIQTQNVSCTYLILLGLAHENLASEPGLSCLYTVQYVVLGPCPKVINLNILPESSCNELKYSLKIAFMFLSIILKFQVPDINILLGIRKKATVFDGPWSANVVLCPRLR